jgi:phospholipid/cholesterol/gamma-HCH transport system ATP-binding protein
MTPPAQPQGVTVEVRDLRKSFRAVEVLKGISFQVSRGERFVIMGPSGSGKSVLLKTIIGLLRPDAGEILIESQSIQNRAVRNQYRMAMVFQSGALLNSMTVGENVGLYLAEHGLKAPAEIDVIVARVLESVGLKGLENRAPSELVLFDEPTSELDPLMAVTVGEEILRLNERTGATSILVTHDRELAFATAHRIAMINEGRILFIGTAQEVQRSTDPIVQRFIRAELATPKTQ